jgi:hypothetical protein
MVRTPRVLGARSGPGRRGIPRRPGWCDIGADGTFDRLDLEGTSIADTLRQVGLDAHADAVSRVRARPMAEGLRVLEAALGELFGAAR